MFNEQKLMEFLGKTPTEEVIDVSGLRGKSVLVTGAGGSIGSALCARLGSVGVKKLVLLDNNEYRLYEVHRKLQSIAVPVLGSYGDTSLVSSLVDVYGVSQVFHVGAYKHVPMVERNPVSAIRNNVFAASNLLDVCAASPVVEAITVISTDKAVRPTNLMGASKALVEQLALGNLKLKGRVRVVRFGNVLGSSGSVIPLFYEQIEAGLPVTVTHAQVDRYFMTVSQAVVLILQAHVMPCGVYVLSMGEAVKIVDIATRMIEDLGRDSEVVFVGLRPGEKLHEELTLGDGLRSTAHPEIMVANEPIPAWKTVLSAVNSLEALCSAGDIGGIRQVLQGAVGYSPVCGIVDDLWLQRYVYNVDALLDDCYKTPEAR